MCLELSGLDEETDTGIWVAVVSQDGSAVGKYSIMSGCGYTGWDSARQTIWKSKN